MRGPISLVIDDGTGERHVTNHARGLRFLRSAFGGDRDLTCSLVVPRHTFVDLGSNDTATLYDARSGGVVFAAHTDNPGVIDGSAGQAYDIQAFGGGVRLQDANTSLAYVVQEMEAVRSGNSTKNAQTSTGERGEDNPTYDLAANEGQTVATDWVAEMIDRLLKRNGLKLARVRGDIDSGIDSAQYVIQLRTGTSDTTLSVRDSHIAATASTTLRATIDGSIATGDNVFSWRVVRNSPTVSATKTHWFRITNVVFRQVLKDIYGTNILTGYTDNTIRAHEVIADMIGRGMAPGANPLKVSIAATSYDIDNLSWPDGITMGDAMAELLKFEPDLWWTLYGDTFTSGLWDEDNPRYVISKADGGISRPGEDNMLCNRVMVTWTDRRNKEHTTVVTSNVPGLDYTRDAEPVQLLPGTGSEGNAQRAGERALALRNHPPRAGTALIRRRIFDRWDGRHVLPHEIMPACCVLEQETGDVLRLTEVDYADDDAAATLTLGSPARTIEQKLVRLERKQRRRG